MNAAAIYLDSSALLKLVFDEAETASLAAFLEKYRVRVSSALARIEVLRITARVHDRVVEQEGRRVLAGVNLIRIDDRIVAAAAMIPPAGLRSLDSIHLATAQTVGHELGGMVVYDRRLAAAARQHGIKVWAPC